MTQQSIYLLRSFWSEEPLRPEAPNQRRLENLAKLITPTHSKCRRYKRWGRKSDEMIESATLRLAFFSSDLRSLGGVERVHFRFQYRRRRVCNGKITNYSPRIFLWPSSFLPSPLSISHANTARTAIGHSTCPRTGSAPGRLVCVGEVAIKSLGKFPGYSGRECHPESGKVPERLASSRRRCGCFFF